MVAHQKKQASCLAVPFSLPKAVMALAAMVAEEVVKMVSVPNQKKTAA